MNRSTNKFHTNLRHPEKKELDIMKLIDKIKDEMYRQKYTVYMLHKALGEAGHTISRDSLYRLYKGETRLNSDTMEAVCLLLDLQLERRGS